MEERFEVVMEPSDLWMVWDKELKTPAVFFNRPLVGMIETEAAAACELLNRLNKKRKQEDAA